MLLVAENRTDQKLFLYSNLPIACQGRADLCWMKFEIITNTSDIPIKVSENDLQKETGDKTNVYQLEEKDWKKPKPLLVSAQVWYVVDVSFVHCIQYWLCSEIYSAGPQGGFCSCADVSGRRPATKG